MTIVSCMLHHPASLFKEKSRENIKNASLHKDAVDSSASFIVWTTSPEADFLRGKFLWANWDVDELKAKREELLAGPQLTFGLQGPP